MSPFTSIVRLRPLRRILKGRFVKFGLVGASGTLVNLGVLYLGQEYLFTAIQGHARLNASLALAICLATVNNFSWNRMWTWVDRKQHYFGRSLFVQFGQYALTCWFSIGMQVVFTKVLSTYFHYLIANLIAIALASIVNFVANDCWTFARMSVAQRLSRQARRPSILP